MCHVDCIIFGATNLHPAEVKGKKIIEVGSLDVNGSLRPIILNWQPSKYVGVDIAEGKGVDAVCNAEDLVKVFGKESFDIVISTELLEHVKDWKKVVSNIKNICKPRGIILITTVSHGFHYHGYPRDYWRYEVSDIHNIFEDCIIERLESTKRRKGISLKVKKPKPFIEKDLTSYKLYCITANKRVKTAYESRFFLAKYLLENFGRSIRGMLRIIINVLMERRQK